MLPSIASGGDLPGGCGGSLNVRRASVNDQAPLAMGAGAVCCRLLENLPFRVFGVALPVGVQNTGLSLRVEVDAGSDHATKIRDPTWDGFSDPLVAPGPKGPAHRTR